MEITFDTIFRVIRKSIALILICAMICAIGAFLVSKYLMKPTYVSVLEINIIGTQDSEGGIVNENNQWVFANRLVKTCKEIIDTNTFKRKVKEVAGIDHKPTFTVSYDEETTVIGINVQDNDRKDAYKIAKAIEQIVNDHLIEKTATSVSVRVIEEPVEPTVPSSPNVMLNTVLVAFIGAVVVVIVEVVRETFGTKVKDEDELRKRYDLPVIAAIPDFNEAMRNSYKYSYSEYASRGTNK